MNITHISFEQFDPTDQSALRYAVIMARFDNKWIFVQHKKRTTFEIPGGTREPDEDIIKTAERELHEETGAHTFSLHPIDVYRVHFDDASSSCGLLCYASVTKLDKLPDSEIQQIHLFDDCPPELTYPLIQPYLFNHCASNHSRFER